MRGYHNIAAYRKEDSVTATRKLRGRGQPQRRRGRGRCLRLVRSIRDWFGMCWGRRGGEEVDERGRLLVGCEGVYSEEGKWDRYCDDYSDSESDGYNDDDDGDDDDDNDGNSNDDSTDGEDERLIGPEDREREGMSRRNSALSFLRTATGKKGRAWRGGGGY